jgi:hypothetical protein
MRRIFALVALIALASAGTATAQSDPAATTVSATDFRPGQWAARFGLTGGGPYGLGALYFTSPRKAWFLDAQVEVLFENYEAGGDSDYEEFSLSVGRRWYGVERSKVRSIVGTGIFGDYNRQGAENSDPSISYGGGVYGELGGAVFFTPDLSLGATWRANLGASYNDGSEISRVDFNAGFITVEGAFYF